MLLLNIIEIYISCAWCHSLYELIDVLFLLYLEEPISLE